MIPWTEHRTWLLKSNSVPVIHQEFKRISTVPKNMSHLPKAARKIAFPPPQQALSISLTLQERLQSYHLPAWHYSFKAAERQNSAGQREVTEKHTKNAVSLLWGEFLVRQSNTRLHAYHNAACMRSDLHSTPVQQIHAEHNTQIPIIVNFDGETWEFQVIASPNNSLPFACQSHWIKLKHKNHFGFKDSLS